MLTVVLCVVLCVCTIAAMWRSSTSNKHKLPPAYPGVLPIIGHSHILMKLADTSNLWQLIQLAAEDAVNKGGVTYARIANMIFYVVADPEDALTASNGSIDKPFVYDFGEPWLGNGLITASGEIWKRHRRIIHPAFGLPVIYGFLNIFNSQAKKLVSEMKSQVGSEPFSHLEYLRKNSLETFCLSTFNISLMDDKQFLKNFMDAIDTALNMVVNRFLTIWQYSDFLYWLSGLQKKRRERVYQFHKLSNNILQSKKAEIQNCNNHNNDFEATGTKYKSFLDLLLELSADGTLTDKEIQDEMNTIIGAGFETTSNQLMYTLLLLGANPDVQNKLFEEVLNVLGPDRNVERDDINKLVYTNAVLMECLRLYPSVPVVLRHIKTDVKLKNYTMRAGSVCVLMPLICRLTWGPDGDKFRPERWLVDPDLCGKKEFAGFGLGKRNCIGRQYAMVTMKIILAHFIRQYRVTADINQLKLKLDFVLKPIAGHNIKIDKRCLS